MEKMAQLLLKLDQRNHSSILIQVKKSKMQIRTIMLSLGHFKKFDYSMCICPKSFGILQFRIENVGI